MKPCDNKAFSHKVKNIVFLNVIFSLIICRINYTFVSVKVCRNGKLFFFENPKSFPKRKFAEEKQS